MVAGTRAVSAGTARSARLASETGGMVGGSMVAGRAPGDCVTGCCAGADGAAPGGEAMASKWTAATPRGPIIAVTGLVSAMVVTRCPAIHRSQSRSALSHHLFPIETTLA